jgi:hypothetical protein
MTGGIRFSTGKLLKHKLLHEVIVRMISETPKAFKGECCSLLGEWNERDAPLVFLVAN